MTETTSMMTHSGFGNVAVFGHFWREIVERSDYESFGLHHAISFGLYTEYKKLF